MQPLGQLLTQYGGTIGRGILMGGADIVPGVSGGTVALILGIYERLVTAISHVDLQLLQLLRKRQWRSAALHLDLPLLVPLGMGVLIGFVIMTTLMHFLLSTQQTRALTLAAFFGLIFASGVLVALMIKIQSRRELIRAVVAGVAGGWFACWVSGLDAMPDGTPPLGFIFCSGAIAICAMILPGISGAMILLVLGVYIHLTEIPGNIVHGQEVWSGLVTVAVFATGCALGLVSFSKVLHRLLEQHHAVTLATLCGFMFGSLRKLWPFQLDLTPHIEKVKFKTFAPIIPRHWDVQVVAVAVVMLAAVACVWAVDWYTHGHLKRLFRNS